MRITPTSILRRLRSARIAQSIGLALVCSGLAFTVGMHTSDNVHPFAMSEAAVGDEPHTFRPAIKGDMTHDGDLGVEDAERMLALIEYGEPNGEEISRGDMDGDSRLTTKDVLRLLHILSLR